ncbi:MAG TPA: RnfABCDGE type electron transport complex subunit D, partial [Chloroflexota bacterium]
PLFVLGAIAEGWSTVLPHMASAMAGAALVELLLARLEKRAIGWPSSALLSGSIVGFVLDPTTIPIVTFIVGATASASKYILATKRGHIFNPAALALIISIPTFATGQSWWGALPDLPWQFIAVLLIGGAFVVDRINKFPLVLSFATTYFSIFTLIALINPTAGAEMFRTPFVQSALFLALFMLTDPPTSPSRERDQLWIGALVAVLSCAAQLAGIGQAYLLVGVLLGNATLAAVRLARESRVARASIPVS